MSKDIKWANFAKAILGAGLIAANVFGGRDLKKGVAIAGEAGVVDATFDLFDSMGEEDNPLSPLTDEMQAKNDQIVAQQKQIEAMKRQIEQLSNAVNRLMAKPANEVTK